MLRRALGYLTATVTVLAAGAAGVASAHVRFVADGEQAVEALAFLVDALTDPLNLLLLTAGAVGPTVAALVYLRTRLFRRDVAVFREVMASYRDLLPWLLRLGFGLPLVGAGFSGYFFNPVVPPLFGGPVTRLFQILVGFLLLFGLATRAAALLGLVGYLSAVPNHPNLLFSAEYVPGLLAVALVGGGRPSADHTLKQVADAEGTFYGEVDPVHEAAGWLNAGLDPYEPYLATVVRVGLGVTFVILGLFEKLLWPGLALNVVEKYDLTAVVPVSPELWVLGAGLSEVGLGVLLLLGLFTRATAMASIFVFTVTLFGLPDDPVLAHISLFAMASALLITGAGPYALDGRLAETRFAAPARARTRTTDVGSEATSADSDD